MSLFPAYGDGDLNQNVDDDKETNWKSNHSYECPAKVAMSGSESDSNTESSSRSPSPAKIPNASVQRTLEFDSTVEFYVDKKPNRAQRELDTLPRLSRPQYKVNQRRLADPKQAPRHRRSSGAKKGSRHLKLVVPGVEQARSEEESNQIMQRIKKLKTLVAKEPKQLNNWIELHHLLNHNLTKTNRLAVAEQQLHTMETALQELPGNEKLLQLYVATLSATYPDSEVATQIEQLLERHPFEYTLWTALIMTTQGTMARCNVPDVLNIYEQCMRRMNRGQKDMDTVADTDDLMLKLFHNCVLFLRQSANCERMFALLKLALELNTQHLNFDCFVARAEVERPLVDYEELVLQSGMPMPEIWTRIERLRQAYNFLPYPEVRGPVKEATDAGLDPQRFIYTEDVCRYIYPLKSKANQLHLMLLAVQLTKLPFVRTNSLADRLSARIDQIGDSEAVEMLLASLSDRYSYLLPLNRSGSDHYTEAMLQLAKELYVSPTFMPHFIGNELYEQCLSQLLLKCSEAFSVDPNDEQKRRVFIILWFRFERLRLLLLKFNGKLTDGYVREARQRQRQLLRLEVNRCVTRFYTELGMFEYEALADADKSSDLRVFDKIMDMPADLNDVDLLHANVIYAEMLFAREQYKQAKHILSCLAVQQSPKSSSAPVDLEDAIRASTRHLGEVLRAANEEAATATDAMPLEDYFMANKLLLLLRVHALLLCMNGQSTEALEMLDQKLNHGIFANVDQVKSKNDKLELTRCRFMREQLREVQLMILQLPSQLFTVRNGRNQLVSMLKQSLLEFPRNLAMMHRWSTLGSLPWYKLRGQLVHTKAGILALLHMVIAARCRFIHQIKSKSKKSGSIDELFGDELQQEHLENCVRNRVLSMFETFLPTNQNRSKEEAEQYAVLRRNSLYWRCYLRCLSNERTSFERSKACLLMALDECPWDKALYMDGVTYVPQEVGNLQDVMTEKQLRIYAIPEELNVLREA